MSPHSTLVDVANQVISTWLWIDFIIKYVITNFKKFVKRGSSCS